MNIAKLKGLMAEHGETQQDIAKLLGITATAFAKKMKQPSRFKFDEVKILSQHYKVDINIFLKW